MECAQSRLLSSPSARARSGGWFLSGLEACADRIARRAASGWQATPDVGDGKQKNRPSDFARAGAVFHQFEITKNSEPSNSAASSSAAQTTEIESHRLSLLWIMNPAPQPAAGALLQELAIVRRFPDPFSDRGVLPNERRGI
jgi:hypothetical protein